MCIFVITNKKNQLKQVAMKEVFSTLISNVESKINESVVTESRVDLSSVIKLHNIIKGYKESFKAHFSYNKEYYAIIDECKVDLGDTLSKAILNVIDISNDMQSKVVLTEDKSVVYRDIDLDNIFLVKGRYNGWDAKNVASTDLPYLVWYRNNVPMNEDQEYYVDYILSQYADLIGRIDKISSNHVGDIGGMVENLELTTISRSRYENKYAVGYVYGIKALDQHNNLYTFIAGEVIDISSKPVGYKLSISSAKVAAHMTQHGVKVTRLNYIKFK